jgi:hypothetical protein
MGDSILATGTLDGAEREKDDGTMRQKDGSKIFISCEGGGRCEHIG